MLGALIIVFREAIEAGLIVGMVMRIARRRDRPWLLDHDGGGGGVLGASIVAICWRHIGGVSGSGQELFNASKSSRRDYADVAQRLG